MAIDADTFLRAATPVLRKLITTQREAVREAGRLVADCVSQGGVVHAFGTGHSYALAMEIAGRAGGLVPTNQLSLQDGILYGGDDPARADPLAERDPASARRIYELARPRPSDMFVIASNSGTNGAIVEMARIVKQHNHPLIAMTSLAQSAAAAPRHPSGRRLWELADVVVDNGAPAGDAIVNITSADGQPQTAVCGISSITAAIAAQMMVAEAIGMLLAAGHSPPVYLSANLPEGDEHNFRLERLYAGRIRRGGA